jgi:hypothetical protein
MHHQLMKRLGVEKISPARSTGYLVNPNFFYSHIRHSINISIYINIYIVLAILINVLLVNDLLFQASNGRSGAGDLLQGSLDLVPRRRHLQGNGTCWPARCVFVFAWHCRVVDHAWSCHRAGACVQSKNFVVYKHYCSNYKKSMDAIQRAKQIPAFADFLRVRA